MKRRTALAGLAVACLAVAGVATAFTSGAVPGLPSRPQESVAPKPPVHTGPVERRTLQVRATVSGTLGYAGTVEVAAGLFGTLTWVPAEAAVLERGATLYEVDAGRKAILFYGARPAWRAMAAGIANGYDVEQLEQNLQALGYAPPGMSVDRHWDSLTTRAVKVWQRAAGLRVDGVVNPGEVVFLPESMRVTGASALGTSAGGATVLQGTTNRRVVAVGLAPNRKGLLALNAPVDVTLPDGTVVPGHVAEIGRVVHGGDGGTGGSSPRIDVTVTLDNASAAGDLDAAPVTVRVVTQSRENVVAVPVSALVALLEGGYAVEVVDPDGSTRYVAVQLGMFDSGWVELVSGEVHEGDNVVLPS